MSKEKAESTALVPLEKKYPVLCQDPEKALAIIQQVMGGAEMNEFDLEVIKVPAGGTTFWEIINEDGEPAPLQSIEGIVLHQSRRRSFWLGDEDPDGSPPDCQSSDCITGIGKIEENGESTQRTCKSCPKAQFGSGKGNTQSCQPKTFLFILRGDGYLPSLMILPVMSAKAWTKFILRNANKGFTLSSYEVSISLVKQTSSGGKEYSCVDPRKLRNLSKEEQETLLKYAQSLRPVFEHVSADMSAIDNEG